MRDRNHSRQTFWESQYVQIGGAPLPLSTPTAIASLTLTINLFHHPAEIPGEARGMQSSQLLLSDKKIQGTLEHLRFGARQWTAKQAQRPGADRLLHGAAKYHHTDSSTAYPYTLSDSPPTHTTNDTKKCGTGIIFDRSLGNRSTSK